VPVTAIMFPARTAREIPTFGSNGDPGETCWRLLLKAVPPFRDITLHPELITLGAGSLASRVEVDVAQESGNRVRA
jgi:hypothetical protein